MVKLWWRLALVLAMRVEPYLRWIPNMVAQFLMDVAAWWDRRYGSVRFEPYWTGHLIFHFIEDCDGWRVARYV